MRKINFILITASLIMFSCSSIKENKTNSSENTDLTNKLEGYWISTNEDYEKSENETILFYGKIDNDRLGVYLQGDKKMTYRILQIDKSNNKIEIAIKFTSSRERIETLTLSDDYNRILNNIITPDGYSIDTYYIRKD